MNTTATITITATIDIYGMEQTVTFCAAAVAAIMKAADVDRDEALRILWDMGAEYRMEMGE